MRIHIGTDHAGFEVSGNIQQRLRDQGFQVVDHGPTSLDPDDDYPRFCIQTARGVVSDLERGTRALGIVLGGTGNGEQIAANKVRGARAALVWSKETAVLARQHNDANICSVGARQHSCDDLFSLVEAFLGATFSGETRHARRIGQITDFEIESSVPSANN